MSGVRFMVIHGGGRLRLCPLGCNGETACKAAKRKAGRPGETIIEPPAPRTCRMFYDEKGEPL